MLDNNQVLAEIQNHFPEQINNPMELYGLLTIEVPASQLIEIMTFLRDHPQFQYIFLTDLTAVHYPDRVGEELCGVYHLHSFIHNHRLRIKTYVPIERPQIPSLVPIFECANWMERETYDYYGVDYVGHPNLVRILNLDEMDYFPMRKEYPLEDQTRRDKVDQMFGR